MSMERRPSADAADEEKDGELQGSVLAADK
jgi:hypothetical protein